MTLSLIANMFKVYRVVKRIRAGPATPTVATPTNRSTPTTLSKNSMIYHVWNPKLPGMTPQQRFDHAVKVRNRTMGPENGTTVSPYLDVEITPDNKRFLKLTPEDLNMHRVLQVIPTALFT